MYLQHCFFKQLEKIIMYLFEYYLMLDNKYKYIYIYKKKN